MILLQEILAAREQCHYVCVLVGGSSLIQTLNCSEFVPLIRKFLVFRTVPLNEVGVVNLTCTRDIIAKF